MLTTIIIEDETKNLEVLEIMLRKHCNEVQVIDSCTTPEEGIRSIKKNNPDLIFLDIEMPRMNGIEMLKKLEKIDFEIIFTTAYTKYAINAIRLSAADYLLKPIDEEELAQAIARCRENLRRRQSNEKLEVLINNLNARSAMNKIITLASVEGVRFIKMKDIIRLEANGRYTRFYLVSKEVITASRTLGDFEETLSANDFFRIHETHMINLSYIDRFHKGNNYVLLTDKTELPLARRRKEEFLNLIPKF